MSFKALRVLPLEEKIAIMSCPNNVPRVSHSARVKKPNLAEVTARWQNLDPVDMESVERNHFLKTGQVLKSSYVKAKPCFMPIANREAQVLGMQLLEELETISTIDFVSLLETMLTAPANRVFHRDMKHDAQFLICKKLMSLTSEEVGSHILSIAMVLNKFETELEIPNRVWRRKVVTAIRLGHARVEKVPSSLSVWDADSRWCGLMAEVLKSGRVKVSNKLLEYFSGKIDSPNADAMLLLLNAFVISGCVDAKLVDKWSLESVDILNSVQLSELIQTRLHFGLDPILSAKLVNHLIANIGTSVTQLPIHSQLMILDCIYAVGQVSLDDNVIRWTNQVCARLPNVDVISLLGSR